MNKNKEYQKTISQIMNSLNRIKEIKDEDEINNPYVDEFTTKQQRSRDKKITELLQLYVEAYNYKNKSNKWYKGILFGICTAILLAFAITLIVLVVRFNGATDEKTIESVVQLITACITFLTLIVSILKIITKYVFPVNDEEYITRIVEIIQNNDLENKKENIRIRIADAEDEDKRKQHQESDSFSTIEDLD
mgnify:CR=1 FL=1